MAESRRYPHAPITEALVDLRVNYGSDISLEKLKSFGSHIEADYPHESIREMVQAQVNFGEAQTQTTRNTIGYIFHSADRLQAVQARLDGFTFSRFSPYQDWNHLISEAKRLWTIFLKSLKPLSVTRLAVRYINQINLPLRDNTLIFEDYLKTFPATALGDDIVLEEFFLRLVMPQADLSAKLILTEALLPPKDNHLGVILDIDLFRENTSFDSHSYEIWDILETFRERKNKYFEASLTDSARGLFA